MTLELSAGDCLERFRAQRPGTKTAVNCAKSRGRARSPEDTDFSAECLRCPGTCLVEGFPDPQVAQKLEVLPQKAQTWGKVGDHLFKDQTLLVFTSRKLPTERFILESGDGRPCKVPRPVPPCEKALLYLLETFFILKPKDVFAPSLLRMRKSVLEVQVLVGLTFP